MKYLIFHVSDERVRFELIFAQTVFKPARSSNPQCIKLKYCCKITSDLPLFDESRSSWFLSLEFYLRDLCIFEMFIIFPWSFAFDESKYPPWSATVSHWHTFSSFTFSLFVSGVADCSYVLTNTLMSPFIHVDRVRNAFLLPYCKNCKML